MFHRVITTETLLNEEEINQNVMKAADTGIHDSDQESATQNVTESDALKSIDILIRYFRYDYDGASFI